jgi:hypothetical protein
MDTYEEGCLCEGDTDTSSLTNKCSKCYTRKKHLVMGEGCTCTCPSFIENAMCGNCNRVNIKYVRAARVAAGEVIAQHFLHEYQPGTYKVEWGKSRRTKNKTRTKKWKNCGECEKLHPLDRLRRRFGETPRTFRKCLEEKILKNLAVGPSENPDEEKAKKTAEKYMHEWMDTEIIWVESRRRCRPDYETDKETKWFS